MRRLICMLLMLTTLPLFAGECLVIAHRGASGYLPEHTLKAYTEGIRLGADYIEPDLVMTADGVVIARHENILQLTTNVATHAGFAKRRRSQSLAGREFDGWFSEDFSHAEIGQLRATERYPDLRPGNTVHDGQYAIPTFEQVIKLAKAQALVTGRPVGLMPELKQVSYFRERGLDLVQAVVDVLKRNYLQPEKNPIMLQSFEAEALRRAKELTRVNGLNNVPLIQLLGDSDPEAIASETSPQALAEIAEYADAIGVPKYGDILPEAPAALPTDVRSTLVENAHAAGLNVYAYTLRAENKYLAPAFRSESDEAAHGDLAGEISLLLEAGIDGFFTDFPDVGRAVCDAR